MADPSTTSCAGLEAFGAPLADPTTTQPANCSPERHGSNIDTQEGLEPVALQSPTNASAYSEPTSELNLNNPDVSTQDHDDKEECATHNMRESPVGSMKAFAPLSPPLEAEHRTRNVTYAASVQGSPRSGHHPARKDSTYYSNRGSDDGGSETFTRRRRSRTRSRDRLIGLRQRVSRTRDVRKERREQADHLREKVLDSLNVLTRKIHELVALGKLSDDLLPEYESLRHAQDELGPAEYARDQLERRLDEEEEALNDEEESFYKRDDIGEALDDSIPDEMISPGSHSTHTTDTEILSISNENPLVREYLEQLEETERMREELENLENDYYQLSGESAIRIRNGIPLTPEVSGFLDDYSKVHSEITNSLQESETVLLSLRAKCLNQGLFDETEHIYRPRDFLYEDVMESIYDAQDRSPLRVAAHDLSYDEDIWNFGNKRDYVNKWLLQWIQDSAVGTLQLQTWIRFENANNSKGHEVLGKEKWAQLVLEHWDSDSAGKLANKYYNASKRDAISGDPRRLHATSTGRSFMSESLRTLGFDDEERGTSFDKPLVGGSTDDELEIPPRKRRASNSDVTQSQAQSMRASFNSSEPITSTPDMFLASSLAGLELQPNDDSLYHGPDLKLRKL